MSRQLDDALHSRIKDLCAQGDALVEKRQFKEAFAFYSEALQLVPDPAEQYEATTWILTAIGDLYFAADKFEKSLTAFQDAVGCAGGLGNPFIHLRLGECRFELGELDRAADELARAYMGAGDEIFANEDEKYLAFLRTRMQGI